MSNDKNKKEIRYFSMFSGVGGFELGLQGSNDLSKTSGNEQRGIKENISDIKQKSLRAEQSSSSINEGNSRSTQHIQSERDSSSCKGDAWKSHQDSRTFKCIGVSEIDKYACKLLETKFPGVRNYGNARDIKPEDLPDFDMLCGGFPCQAFSIAGKRKGFEDTRGTLFFEIARILKVKRPKTIFLENVKGLLNHGNGQTFSTILQTLSELGYECQWMVLNSKFFGVPQNRERIFIIGNLREESRPEILPFRKVGAEASQLQGYEEVTNTIHARLKADSNGTYIESRWETPLREEDFGNLKEITKNASDAQRIYDSRGLARALKGLGGGQGAKTGLYSVPFSKINLNKKTRDVKEAIRIAKKLSIETGKPVQLDILHLKHGEIRPLTTYIPQDLDTHRCLQAGEPKEVLIQGVRIRRLTPLECERLQGFPDNWTADFSDSQRYKMMGNAVTTNVIKAIGEKINGRK